MLALASDPGVDPERDPRRLISMSAQTDGHWYEVRAVPERGPGGTVDSVLVVARDIAGAEREMLGFETLTFAPIDRDLIAAEMLTESERAWLNAYHADVLALIGPQVEGDVRAWLEEACRPL